MVRLTEYFAVGATTLALWITTEFLSLLECFTIAVIIVVMVCWPELTKDDKDE